LKKAISKKKNKINLSKKYSSFQNRLKILKNDTLILTLIVALKTKFNFSEVTIIGLGLVKSGTKRSCLLLILKK
jgi:hypothetical protein